MQGEGPRECVVGMSLGAGTTGIRSKTSKRKAKPCPTLWKAGHHGLGEASSSRKAFREEAYAQASG